MPINNPNVVYTTLPTIGVGLNLRTNVATDTNVIAFALGTTVVDANSKVWVYVHATNAMAANTTVTILWGTGIPPSVDCQTVGTKTMQNFINGSAPFVQNDYGWVQSVNRLGYNRPVANVS